MDFEQAVMLLKEFDYERNGKDATVGFLIYILNQLYNVENEDE